VLCGLVAWVVVLAQRDVGLAVVLIQLVHQRVVVLGSILLATQRAEVSDLQSTPLLRRLRPIERRRAVKPAAAVSPRIFLPSCHRRAMA
jgi:hypothetical protein